MEPKQERKGGRKLLDVFKSPIQKLIGRSRSSSRTPTSTAAVGSTSADNATPRAATAIDEIRSVDTSVITPAGPLPRDFDEAEEVPKFPLWDTALQTLQDDPDTKEVMTEYQKILETQAARIPDKKYFGNASQPRNFSKVIKLGLADIDAKMWKINLDPERRPIVIREQVNRILKTVKKFSGIAAMAASFDPVHAGVAWAGVSAILPFLLNISEQDDHLRNGLVVIADLIAWHANVERLLLGDEVKRANSGSLIKSIFRVYKAILIYQAEAARYVFRSTLGRTARSAVEADTWKGYLQTITAARENCKVWVDFSSTKLLSDQISDVQKILDRFKDESREKTRVLEWLSDRSHAATHRKIQRDAGEGYADCGAWLLRPENPDALYPAWKSLTRGQLSLQGFAGTGKSTLTSMVIEDLTNGENPPNVAFYYCKRQVSSSVDKILQSLVAQLAYSGGATSFPELERLYKTRSFPAPDKCIELLLEAIRRSGPTYIVVDGWDESDAPNALLKYLKSLWEASTSLKIFLSSRIEDEVKLKFPDTALVLCNKETNDLDIRSYIGSALKDENRRNREVVTETMAKDMTDKLTQNASGMFLWVKLQLDLLLSEEYRIDSKDEFNRRLASLTSGSGEDNSQKLNHTYRDILDRNLKNLGLESAKCVKEALKWVACSAEPLSAKTLLQAVKMNTKDDLTDKQLWKRSRNLLAVHETGIIHFTHFSVQEFVEFEETLAGAHGLAALTCLTLTLDCTLRKSYKVDEKCPELAKYASLFWPFHCGNAGLGVDWYTTTIGKEVMRVLTPEILTSAGIKNKVSSSLKTMPILRESWISKAKENGAIHDSKLGLTMIHDGKQLLPDDFLMACYLGWQWLLDDLGPEEIIQYNTIENSRGQSGLHLAIKQGRIGIVISLLEGGADPQRCDRADTTPLGLATLTDQSNMVKLLLGFDIEELESEKLSLRDKEHPHRKRADVNGNAYESRNTALHLAALYNLPEIAEILCQVEEINPNIRNDKGATALIDSALVGSVEVARILIDRDDTDLRVIAVTELGKLSALHATESPEIAKLLLDKDPDLALLTTGSGVSVLSWWLRNREATGPFADAAYERDLLARLNIMLSCKEIGINDFNTVFREPACMQRVTVLRQLWNDPRSSSPDSWKDTSGDTLLHHAAAEGSSAVIQFLLDHGADATSLNDKGKTALEVAQQSFRDEIVVLLKHKRGKASQNA